MIIMEQGTVKLTYKDGIFRSLFNNEKELLKLYNALSGENYPEGTAVEIVTLEDVIFNDSKNDIAFIIDNKFINLIEHQSTMSPNLPLRMLEYIAKEYRKMCFSNAVYSETKIMIPTPEFYVFYNGAKDAPLYQELKLSDAFMSKCDTIALELKVKVINVNLEKGAELLERCHTLKEYSILISRVREKNRQCDDLDSAIKESIEECIKEGILLEYLRKHKGEVMSFLHVQLSQEERDAIRIKDGEVKKAKEIAKALKKEGISEEIIIRTTGLSETEIRNLE